MAGSRELCSLQPCSCSQLTRDLVLFEVTDFAPIWNSRPSRLSATISKVRAPEALARGLSWAGEWMSIPQEALPILHCILTSEVNPNFTLACNYFQIFIFLQRKITCYECISLFIKRKVTFILYSDFLSVALIKANDNLAHFIDIKTPSLTPPK